MIREIASYTHDELWPRFSRVLAHPNFILSAATAVAITVGTHFRCIALSNLKLSEFAGYLVAYFGIAFALCIAAQAVSLTLPSVSFMRKLARAKLAPRTSSFGDLLFVFSWTSLVHWFGLLLVILFIVLNDSNSALADVAAHLPTTLLLGLLIFFSVYGFLQLFVVCVTLAQLGRLFVRHVEAEDAADKK